MRPPGRRVLGIRRCRTRRANGTQSSPATSNDLSTTAAGALFVALQARRPGGFPIAALLRPPDAAAGEDASYGSSEHGRPRAGPLGHHTHFVGPDACPAAAGGGGHADRVRREALWLREHGLEPRLFCGGGWYIDEEVAAVLAELGYADCTGTAFVPSYLGEGEPRLAADEPAWLTLAQGRRLLELPSTHSLGMAARGGDRARSRRTSMCTSTTRTCCRRKRRIALRIALEVLSRRCEVTTSTCSERPPMRLPAELRPTLILPWQASLRPPSSPPSRRRNAAT